MFRSIISWFKNWLWGNEMPEQHSQLNNKQVERVEVLKEVIVDMPDFQGMTKTDLDIYARGVGLKLDKRNKKDTMINDIKNHLTKEN